LTFRRDLSGKEARAWATSLAFRKVVKGQLVCIGLDADADDPRVEVYALGVLVWAQTVTNDDFQEFFDADSNELGAEERELLATLP
jgi:hypothetical protein